MTAPTTAPVAVLEGVTWVADAGLPTEREVLAGVDLSIGPGERVGLVGPSGAGKTTLVTLLAGLLEPDSGTVRTDRPIGLAFQEPERGFFEETVLEDVAFGPRNAGLPEDEAREVARDALRRVGLDPESIGRRAPETLSGGEARRAALAGVLVGRPRLLVLDEPTTGLDSEGRDRLWEILDAEAERGTAVLLVSHDLSLVLERCDRLGVLEEGRIVWNGPTAALAEGLPVEWPAALRGDEPGLPELTEALRAQGLLDPADRTDFAVGATTPEALARQVILRMKAGF